MGRLGNNPSSRGYATPTYSTTQITARETFGGPAKAGLGRHIGMGEWTFGAIVNGSSGRSGHTAPPFAGMNFPKAFHAGRLPTLHYPISKTNQLARVGVGTTGGMTRTPADGVNTEQRKAMELRVGHWNAYWPARPIRDTPNNCCYVDPVGKMDLNSVVFLSVIYLDDQNNDYDVDIRIWNSVNEVLNNFKELSKNQVNQISAFYNKKLEAEIEGEEDTENFPILQSDFINTTKKYYGQLVSFLSRAGWQPNKNYRSGDMGNQTAVSLQGYGLNKPVYIIFAIPKNEKDAVVSKITGESVANLPSNTKLLQTNGALTSPPVDNE